MKALLSILAAAALLGSCAGPSARVQAVSPAAQQSIAEAAFQVRRCYRSPRVPSVGRRIVTRLFVRYAPDGSLLGTPALVSQQGVTPENRPYAARMAEAASLAVIRCSPVHLSPELHQRGWSELLLTFSPRMMA